MDAKKVINDTLEYLKKTYPQDKEVTVHICEGYECIDTGEGVGFAVFNPETLEIYIATELPEPDREFFLIETMAHEYKHFMQLCEGKPFDEKEAEEFGEKIANLLYGQQVAEGEHHED